MMCHFHTSFPVLQARCTSTAQRRSHQDHGAWLTLVLLDLFDLLLYEGCGGATVGHLHVDRGRAHCAASRPVTRGGGGKTSVYKRIFRSGIISCQILLRSLFLPEACNCLATM